MNCRFNPTGSLPEMKARFRTVALQVCGVKLYRAAAMDDK
jgi:hypothetical protein